MKALWFFLLLASPLHAQDLRLPGNAISQLSDQSPSASLSVATDIWADGTLPMQSAVGIVSRDVWRLGVAGLTTQQLLGPLRGQLLDSGWVILLECETDACGGYDFRFGVPVVDPPTMQVSLGDFRYLSASNGEELVSLLVSRTPQAGFVQIMRVSAAAPKAATPTTPLRAAGTTTPGDDISAALNGIGRAILSDLAFETGSAQLRDEPYASLQALAAYLAENPDLTVALVGHTDASGALDGNIALSKRRAGSVLERLVTRYDVPRRQLEAQGMGYLAPIANNRSAEGRDANRRVEVIVTATN